MGHSRFSVTMDYYADWFDEDADAVLDSLGW
jgi:integrase